jgi:CheY-like chemotaxis protein
MRYIVVNNSIDLVQSMVLQEQIKIINSLGFYEIIEEFKTLALETEDVIILNAENKFQKKDNHSDFKGVSLLKWLRVHLNNCNKIITTSFVTREYLLQNNPENYILFAPDNYFLQIPFTLDRLENILKKSQVIKNKEILIKEYKPFVSPDFKISDISHSFSNEFGIYILANLLQQVFKRREGELGHNNLQFSKAKMLYDLNFNVFEYQAKLINKRNSTSKLLANKKIVYVDDKGDGRGWFNLMRQLLNIDSNQLAGVKPEALGDRENTINYSATFEDIKNHSPDIILLDLRLLGDFEKNTSIEKTSGAVLLQMIRKWNPAIPVMLTSATDRIKSYDILNKSPYNIDAIWTKPRVDNRGFNASKSLLDLYQKMKLLVKLSNDELGLVFKEIDYRVKNDLLPKIKLNYINQYDFILFDSNYFCDTSKDIKDYILHFYSILKMEERSAKIVVIDDVMKEVYLNSHKNKGLKNKKLSRVSRYSSELLSELFNLGKIVDLYQEVDTSISRKFLAEYEPIENNFDRHNIYYSLKIKQASASSEEIAKRKTNALNEELIQRNNPTIIHADNVFKFLIKDLLQNDKKVLFISNDITCKRDIVLHYPNGKSANDYFKADYSKDENGRLILNERGSKIKTQNFRHNKSFDLNKNCKLIRNLIFIRELSLNN